MILSTMPVMNLIADNDFRNLRQSFINRVFKIGFGVIRAGSSQ